MSLKLKLPSCLKRIEREDKILFFNPDIPAWLVTNYNGALLLSFCDGKNSISDILDALADSKGIDEARKAKIFFDEAIKSGIFEEPILHTIPIKKEQQKLSLVQFSISSKCNLNCKYCYATDRVESLYPKMNLNEYKRVVDDITGYSNGTEFTLTGGEPLLNEDVFDIALYIRSRHSSVDLLTNGTLITQDNIERIKEAFSKVSMSLDGSTREQHELFRGDGSYDKTMKAIDLLDSHGIPCRLSMTVNRMNIKDVESMARKYGDRLSFQPLFPAGNAKKSDEDISITGKEYYDALKNAYGVNPMGYCEPTLDASRQKRRCKCAIGGSELSISETGDVYPCQLLHYPQFLIGNIHKDKVSDLHKNSPVVRQCSEMVVDNIKGCDTCFLRYVCGGACRARAFHECSDILSCGSFCEYEKEAFVDGIFEIYSSNFINNSRKSVD